MRFGVGGQQQLLQQDDAVLQHSPQDDWQQLACPDDPQHELEQVSHPATARLATPAIKAQVNFMARTSNSS
jgi:hypothetical protein